MKALCDVTYRIEQERRKAGQRRNRKVVHFNYLKPCFTPPPVHKKRPQASTSGEAARSELRDVLQPTQAGADDSGGVELEWLEDPVVLTTEGHVMPRVQGASATLDLDAQSLEVPYPPKVPSVNNESSQIPVRPTREPRESSCLWDHGRTTLLLEQLFINFLIQKGFLNICSRQSSFLLINQNAHWLTHEPMKVRITKVKI